MDGSPNSKSDNVYPQRRSKHNALLLPYSSRYFYHSRRCYVGRQETLASEQREKLSPFEGRTMKQFAVLRPLAV